MIPNITILQNNITEITYPSRTYKIQVKNPKSKNVIKSITFTNLNDSIENLDRINGYVDGLEAIIQAIYLILSTERYQFIIYSWDYGVELIDLIGQPMNYVISEIPRRIKEALLTDNRILNVTDFSFVPNNNKLYVTFTVITDVGNVNMELEAVI